MRIPICAAVAVAVGLALPAQAQDWPTEGVTLVFPFPPGGPADLVARPIAEKLQAKWGQPVVIDNRAGATGTIGAAHVARAKPDGYILLYTVDLPITMAPHLLKVPYDPQRDFEMIAAIAETEQMLVVHPSLNVSTFDQLIAKAKAEPGKLTYSSAGVGSPGHLCIEMISRISDTRLVHVPYRGGQPAMNAIAGGEVDVFCGTLTQGLPHVKAKRLVPLAASGRERAALTPDVPTLMEAGLKDFVIYAQYYLMAPKGTPAPVLDKIGKDFKEAMDDPEIRKLSASIGSYPKWLPGEQGMALLRSDFDKWAAAIKAAGLQPQ